MADFAPLPQPQPQPQPLPQPLPLHADLPPIFDGAFNYDDFAYQYEALENSHNFLYTGKPPLVGALTVTTVSVPGGGSAHLIGIVTDIDAAPTDEEMVASGTNFSWPLHSGAERVAAFGGLHGQMLTVRAVLSPNFYHEPYIAALGISRVWSLRYRMDDHKVCMWVVVSATPLDLGEAEAHQYGVVINAPPPQLLQQMQQQMQQQYMMQMQQHQQQHQQEQQQQQQQQQQEREPSSRDPRAGP